MLIFPNHTVESIVLCSVTSKLLLQRHLDYETNRVVCNSLAQRTAGAKVTDVTAAVRNRLLVGKLYEASLRGGGLSQDLPGTGVLPPETQLPECVLIISK